MADWNPSWLSELDRDPWEWQTTCKILDDCFVDVPGCLWDDDKVAARVPFVCDDPVTPSQGSKEVSVKDDESEDVEIVDEIPEEASSRLKRRKVEMVDETPDDPSPRFKRRKLLQYKSDSSRLGRTMPVPGLRSQSVAYPVEEELSEQSDGNLQCPEGALVGGSENLDDHSEAWISCLIDDQDDRTTPVQTVDEVVQTVDEDVQIADEFVQIVDEPPICSNESYPPVQIETAAPAINITKHAVPSLRTRKHGVRIGNMPLKLRKPVFKGPTSKRSYIAYPFTFIKPSALAGEVTLEDINRQLLSPPQSALQPKDEEDDLSLYPTSAFSGKPVVGSTTIRTEGGKGAITIMRTKG